MERVYDDDVVGGDAGTSSASSSSGASTSSASSASSSSSGGVDAGDTDSGDGAATDSGKVHDDGAADAPITAPAQIGGTVLGLAGSGLVLQNNGVDDLTVVGGGFFSFPIKIGPGQPYDVTVRSQPSAPAQTCAVSPSGKGTANGVDVFNVNVTCTTNAYSVGGSLIGLQAGKTIVLTNNGGNDLTVPADGPFVFGQSVPSGGNFNVAVKTSPAGQTCNVSGGSGAVVAAKVESVVVNCGANTYTVGGTVSGLAGTLVLHNTSGAGEDKTITSNGEFAFSTPVASGGSYTVTVKTAPSTPPLQTCTVNGAASASGPVTTADITSINVQCTTRKFSVGGNVTGLTGAGLVLQNNGTNNTAVAAPGGAFTFSTQIASAGAYNVSILSQPAGQTCTLIGGTAAGTVTTGNVTSVALTCGQPVALSENFDGVAAPGLPPGWTATKVQGLGPDKTWETATGVVNSGSNAVFILDFDHSTEMLLDSPSFLVSSASAKLTFWNRWKTEWGCDGGSLSISIAGSAFQDILAAGGSFSSGGYNDTLGCYDGRPAWAGNDNGGWFVRTTAVNLPPSAAGKMIVLRWRSTTDDGLGDDGWRIDDVVVTN